MSRIDVTSKPPIAEYLLGNRKVKKFQDEFVEYSARIRITVICLAFSGDYHTDGSEPSYIEEVWCNKYATWKPFSIQYHSNGRLHRLDGPAATRYEPGSRNTYNKLDAWYHEGRNRNITYDGISNRTTVVCAETGKELYTTFMERRSTGTVGHPRWPAHINFETGIIQFMDNMRPHRNHGPAVILWKVADMPYNVRGHKPVSITETWYEQGAQHRIDGPARIQYYYNLGEPDSINSIEYLVEGRTHRDDGPARSTWMDGLLTSEKWFKEGHLHRIGGPAAIDYHRGYGPSLCAWYVDGILHREHEPALEEYNTAGDPIRIHWYYKGRRHRSNGPAVTYYAPDGSVATVQFYKSGQELDATMFEGVDDPDAFEFIFEMA